MSRAMGVRMGLALAIAAGLAWAEAVASWTHAGPQERLRARTKPIPRSTTPSRSPT